MFFFGFFLVKKKKRKKCDIFGIKAIKKFSAYSKFQCKIKFIVKIKYLLLFFFLGKQSKIEKRGGEGWEENKLRLRE